MAVWLMQVLLQDIVVGSSDPKVKVSCHNVQSRQIAQYILLILPFWGCLGVHIDSEAVEKVQMPHLRHFRI